MAVGVGVGIGGGNGWGSPQQSYQRQFLDHMRHREPEAWQRFMNRYRGMDFTHMPMRELERRFQDEVSMLREELHYGITIERHGIPHVAPAPTKQTWFEEIQAEVNEWLAGVET